jgi:hypothetical protein
LSRLLDRRLIQSFNSRYLNIRNTRFDFLPFVRSGITPGHHPRPDSRLMRDSVKGRRVHAVVMRGLDFITQRLLFSDVPKMPTLKELD